MAGMPGLSPRVASAAMALVTAAIEPKHEIVAFTSGQLRRRRGRGGRCGGLAPVAISPRSASTTSSRRRTLPFGGTDCALPMQWAADRKCRSTRSGVHRLARPGPATSTRSRRSRYRQKTGIGAKLVVIGMVSNGFTIADPNDAGMLDVVGFDTATPEVIADFARGEI